jgi:hypothetical protein
MTFLWLATVASFFTAVVAWNRARRATRRLEQLSQLYWELRYQHGELRAQLQRRAEAGAAPTPAPPAPATEVFVPLASLKR